MESKSEFVYTGSQDDFEITDLIDWLTSIKEQGYNEIYWNVNMDRFEQLDSIEITVFKSEKNEDV